jgi:hypothetical protein
MVTVVVLAKEPRSGRVKTRLCPPYSLDQAAHLARAALADTIAAVDAWGPDLSVCALDGERGDWLPASWTVRTQRDGDLGERIAGALDDAFAIAGGPVLLIGMDTPQICPAHLDAAATALASADAVLGPAADGGWWLLGLHRPDRSIVTGIPTSRADTGAQQRTRLVEHGLRVADLPVLRDVDTAADADEVAALAPETRFASVVRRLTEAVA